MIQIITNSRNFRRLIGALAVGLCLVSACARLPRIEEEEPVACWPCRNLPELWYWDADEDGVDDFEVSFDVASAIGYGVSATGIGRPGSYSIYIHSIYEDINFHPTNLLYPLEQGQWINSNTEWNEYNSVSLGRAVCGEFESWEGPFTGPEGDLIAFRIEGTSKNLVGVARFKMWDCDGYIDILDLRLESELYGVIVGE